MMKISNNFRSWSLHQLIILILYERGYKQVQHGLLLQQYDNQMTIAGVQFTGQNPSQRFVDQFCLIYQIQNYISASTIRQIKINQYPSYYQMNSTRSQQQITEAPINPNKHVMTMAMLFELLQAYLTGNITDLDEYQEDDVQFVKQTLRKFFGIEKLTKVQAKCLKSHINQHHYNITKILNLMKNILELRDVTKRIFAKSKGIKLKNIDFLRNKYKALQLRRQTLRENQSSMQSQNHNTQSQVQVRLNQINKSQNSDKELTFDDIRFNQFIRTSQLRSIKKRLQYLKRKIILRERCQGQGFAVKKNAVFNIKNAFLNYILNKKFAQNIVFCKSSFREFMRGNHILQYQLQNEQQYPLSYKAQLIREITNGIEASVIQAHMEKLISLITREYFLHIILKYNKENINVYTLICYYWKLTKKLLLYQEEQYEDILEKYKARALAYEEKYTKSQDKQTKKNINTQRQKCQIMIDILQVIFQQPENYLHTATQIFKFIQKRFINSSEINEVQMVLKLLSSEKKVLNISLNHQYIYKYINIFNQDSISNQHEQQQSQQDDESTDEESRR